MSTAEPDFRRWSVSIPHRTLVAAIRREMDEYLSYFAELEVLQKRADPDHDVLDERRIVLIILISSYLEAVINLYFAFAFDAAEMKRLDRLSVLTKWTKIPAKRIPAYTFDKHLFNEFNALVECRHAIAHMQPEFGVEDKIIHTGNSDPLHRVSHETIMRWAGLPLELVKNIESQDKSQAGRTLSRISDVWDASQGWDDRLKFYRSKYSTHRGQWRFSA